MPIPIMVVMSKDSYLTMIKDPVLSAIIAPLGEYFNQKDVTEVSMAEPCQVTVKRRNGKDQYYNNDKLGLAHVKRICEYLANSQGLDFSNGKLSCVIPDVFHRFECAIGPSIRGQISLSIRCKHPFIANWKSLEINNTVRGFLIDSVKKEHNIIISGATNTGKTTLLNMLLEFVPISRKVVAIEDTPEINLDRFDQSRGLMAERDKGPDSASGRLDWKELVEHVQRITPDHVIFGEISTENAYGALSVLNSGTRGFLCTIHAESAKQVIERKFDQNISWSGKSLDNIDKYLIDLIDCIIQIKRRPDSSRYVSEVYLPKREMYLNVNGHLDKILTDVDEEDDEVDWDGEGIDIDDIPEHLLTETGDDTQCA